MTGRWSSRILPMLCAEKLLKKTKEHGQALAFLSHGGYISLLHVS
jgi:hypothetical protein